MGSNHIEHNGSGYADPTVDAVIKREYDAELKTREKQRYNYMVGAIKRILDDNGYTLEGPISLIHDSGRKRRIY